MIQPVVMKIMTDAELLAKVEAFLERTKMPATRFGRETMADGSLVTHLRAGRSLSLANAGKVVAFMVAYRAPVASKSARKAPTSQVAA
jgi:hypothetical protein